ncbi:MAG: hypothetical protein ACD_15C00111G0020 [uncultured bacterium]|nr:MAG: hypothetical protein ACD_15C00111G0020 [uncultured bacterium]
MPEQFVYRPEPQVEKPLDEEKKKEGEEVENETNEDGQHSASYIRHSASNYDTYVMQKDRLDKKFDPRDQKFPDLSSKGLELAENKAEEFFRNLDPEKDVLFFASSNEARTLATANIYRQEAERRGFEIIKPTKTNLEQSPEDKEAGKTDLHEETDGYVRMSSMLSLNPRDYIEHSIFVAGLPQFIQDSIADRLPEELRVKWRQAREIINNAPADVKKGGFGEVYHRYADQIKELFPNVRNAEQMEKRFQNILKLAKWGMDKAKEAGLEKNLKILGFGHENYASPVLEKYFGDRDMANCEALGIEAVSEDEMSLERRGEKAEISL